MDKRKVKLSLFVPWRRKAEWWYRATHFNFGTRWTRPLYPWGNNIRYPLNSRLGEPRRQSRRFGEGKSLASARNRTTIPRFSSPYSSHYIKNAIQTIHNGQFHCYQSTQCWFWPYISTFTLFMVLRPPLDRFTGGLRVLFLGCTKRLENLNVIHNNYFQKVGIFGVSCWKVWENFFPSLFTDKYSTFTRLNETRPFDRNFLGYIVTWSNTHHIIVPPAAA